MLAGDVPPTLLSGPEQLLEVRRMLRAEAAGGEPAAAAHRWPGRLRAALGTRGFATELLTALSERIPVVLLNNGLELDDHIDIDLDSPRIITLAERMTPATNLHVQTAVLAHARAFVGTYGGLAYLPPHLGTPSLTFIGGGPPPFPRHLELAQQIFHGPPWGSLAMLTTRDLDVLELVAGARLAAAAP